ncbi:Glycerol-3-phosphate dehydrogenase NAD(P)+ [Carnimonas sp. R-84981]|uniref:NAD(P)H-dependent glycerol-3-phosphate dehydrogenase n=1 Tax=Carnimonas bestiolae TaxID=3402172 RepID=UPI003EDC495F
MQETPAKVAVIGGGSFGTALASIAASGGAQVRQWLRDAALAERINRNHVNDLYLPDFAIHSQVAASTDVAWVLEEATLVLVAIPSKAFREVVRQAAPFIPDEAVLISTTKGIEAGHLCLMSDVLMEETSSAHVGVLSGPNLAAEVAQYQLTASVIASEDEHARALTQHVLSCDHFRVYANSDRHGVELAGTLKNIYAIAAGMAQAMGLGENTKAMLMTRALAEMSRFAVDRGANPLTFLGLAGVGDLIVTCSSPLSRNFRVGRALGEGLSLEQAVASLGQVAEGVNTVRLIYAEAQQRGVYMPLLEGLYRVMFEQVPAAQMAQSLMRNDHASDVEFTLSREDTRQAHQHLHDSTDS